MLSDRLLTATKRGMQKFAAHWQTGARLHQPCSPLIASGVPFGSQALGGWISRACRPITTTAVFAAVWRARSRLVNQRGSPRLGPRAVLFEKESAKPKCRPR